ncbi:hypothetical protein GQX74_002591 [Glossina fuscipes]|nr:hypothetical protein GQX74_002591 [Glossina fuscipes]
MNNITTYVNACYTHLRTCKQYPPFVVIQLCKNHTIKLVHKDVENFFDQSVDNFIKWQKLTAMHCSGIKQFFRWIGNFLPILSTYAPLWTNIMGVHIDSDKPASNSPVEGYFSIGKNINLDGQKNIRPTDNNID